LTGRRVGTIVRIPWGASPRLGPKSPWSVHSGLTGKIVSANMTCGKETAMVNSKVLLRVGLLVAAAVALAFAAASIRDKHEVAVSTVDDIEAQLAALDPATRAAVIARLTRDAARVVHDKRKGA